MMKIIFLVSEKPILNVELASGKITRIDVISEILTQAVFPSVLDTPNEGDLLSLLRFYADIKPNASLEDIVEQTGGEIPFIEFKDNLSIKFK